MDVALIARKVANLHSDLPGAVYEDQTLTHGQLYERACRLASGLLEAGVKPGDRVATLGLNMLESAEEIVAFALGGFVRSPLYAMNPVAAHIDMLTATGARALIVQESFWTELGPRISEAPSVQVVIVHGRPSLGSESYRAIVDRASALDPGHRWNPEELYQIRFSSGTTGKSKSIAHSVRGWLAIGGESLAALPRMGVGDGQLIMGPMSHGSGFWFWATMARGMKHVLMPAFDAPAALQIIEREQIAMTSLIVPTMIQMLVNHPDASSTDLSSLRCVPYGGAPISEQTLLDALKTWGNIMYQVYGQSEGGPATILRASDHEEGARGRGGRLRSAGSPLPNAFVRIVDEDGLDLAAGDVGEIAIHTPGNMLGIWDDPAATAERVFDGGWLRTRDLGYLDDAGYLFVTDRVEDMIISGGYNIWPAELENALSSHPAVLEAVVVGVPDQKWGETPKAVVTLKEHQIATEAELIEWCRGIVGGVKKPTSVVISTEALPKSPVGKVLRRVVREQYSHGARPGSAPPDPEGAQCQT